MTTLALIKQRRDAVLAQIEQLQLSLEQSRAELDELEISERVVARLSGQSSPEPATPETDEKDSRQPARPSQSSKKPQGLPPTRELVFEALMDARDRGLPGLAPKDIRDFVEKRYGYNMGTAANSVPSYLWRNVGKIEKDLATGLFSMPKKNEAHGVANGKSAPWASEVQPKQGGEARLGGGT